MKSSTAIILVTTLVALTYGSEEPTRHSSTYATPFDLSFTPNPAPTSPILPAPTTPEAVVSANALLESAARASSSMEPSDLLSDVYRAHFTAKTAVGVVEYQEAYDGPRGLKSMEFSSDNFNGAVFRTTEPSGLFYRIDDSQNPVCERSIYAAPSTLFVIPSTAELVGQNQCRRDALCDIFIWEADEIFFTAFLTTDGLPVYWSMCSGDEQWTVDVHSWESSVTPEDFVVDPICLEKPHVSKDFQGAYEGWLLLLNHTELLHFNDWQVNADWDAERYYHYYSGYNPDIDLHFQEALLIHGEEHTEWMWDPETTGCLPMEYPDRDYFPRYFLDDAAELVKVFECEFDDDTHTCELWGLDGFDLHDPGNDDRMETTLIRVPGDDSFMRIKDTYITILYGHEEEEIIYEKRWNWWTPQAPAVDAEFWEIPEQCK